ncbi:MAG: orotidine-5'-phosphate decarboxylase [Acidimicrobiales bacterium]
MVESFGIRLQAQLRERGPLCVGIDPSRSLIESWGREDTVEGLEFFSLAVLEAVSDTVAVIKPQIAFFERFGSQGFRVLERLMSEARDAQLMIVADVKRGDVDTTNDGYAEAWLGEASPLRADAMTVSPYLGVDSLEPMMSLARVTGRGVFVLAATSNVEGRAIQDARTSEGESVESFVLEEIRRRNQSDDGLGPFGAVLGATRDRPQFALETLKGPYLVPGVGSQGGTPENVARMFDRCPAGSVLASVSRAILHAGPEQSSLRDAARRWRDDLADALT